MATAKQVVEGKPDSRQLPCKMTDVEVAQRGRDLAEISGRLAAEKVSRLASIKRHKAVIDGLEETIKDMVAAVNNGTELREVPCTWRFNYATKKATLVRDDTMVEVETRDMIYDELQTTVPGAYKDEVDENESDNKMPTTRKRKSPGKNKG